MESHLTQAGHPLQLQSNAAVESSLGLAGILERFQKDQGVLASLRLAGNTVHEVEQLPIEYCTCTTADDLLVVIGVDQRDLEPEPLHQCVVVPESLRTETASQAPPYTEDA